MVVYRRWKLDVRLRFFRCEKDSTKTRTLVSTVYRFRDCGVFVGCFEAGGGCGGVQRL